MPYDDDTSSRLWYCLNALVDWRTVYRHGGDLTIHRMLKIICSIMVNFGIITITMYRLVEATAALTWIVMLGIPTLALYNGGEVADYAALAQFLYETVHRALGITDRVIEFMTQGYDTRLNDAEVAKTKAEASMGVATVDKLRGWLNLDPLDPPLGGLLLAEFGGVRAMGGGRDETVKQLVTAQVSEVRE